MPVNWDVECDRCGKEVRGGTRDGETLVDTVPEVKRVAGAEENVRILVRAVATDDEEEPERTYCLKCLRFLLENAEEVDLVGIEEDEEEEEPPRKTGAGS